MIDQIVVEAVRAALQATAEEMKICLIRSAHGHILNQALDFGCGVFDEEGNAVGEAIGLPYFQGALGFAVKAVIRSYGWERIEDGDIFVHNDPYDGGGNHLNDVLTLAPVFYRRQPAGFVAVKGHLMDIGAATPGIGSMNGTEVYGEGLRFQAVKLYQAGTLNEQVMRIIRGNVRPEVGVMHDLEAMVAVCRTGVAQYLEVINKYGLEVVRGGRQKMMEQSELRTRRAIEAIPDGDYSAEGVLDNDGVDLDRRVRVAVIIAVKGSEMTIDLSRSDPQTRGPVNCGSGTTLARCRLVLKSVTTPDDPVDEGCFRPLRVILPPGLVLSAQEPAPVAGYFPVGTLMAETCFRALAQALPERIPAGGYGDMMSHPTWGRNPETGKLFLLTDNYPGGLGARPFADGGSALFIRCACTMRNVPVEMVEGRYPYVRSLRYSLRQDSGGPGKFRGGLGSVRDWHFMADVEGTFSLERSVCPPWGLSGGKDGVVNRRIMTTPDGKSVQVRKGTRVPLAAGSTLSTQSGGGGGYGDPYERDVERVLADVTEGYVSVEGAREYGVVVDPATLRVDERATAELRAGHLARVGK